MNSDASFLVVVIVCGCYFGKHFVGILSELLEGSPYILVWSMLSNDIAHGMFLESSEKITIYWYDSCSNNNVAQEGYLSKIFKRSPFIGVVQSQVTIFHKKGICQEKITTLVYSRLK
jgi:hypothetical protein